MIEGAGGVEVPKAHFYVPNANRQVLPGTR